MVKHTPSLGNGLAGRYARLIASLEGIVWEADPYTLDFTFVSPQAERILGFPVSAWLEPGFWAAHMHPTDREWAVTFCSQATARGEGHEFQYRMIAADGRVVWLRDLVHVEVRDGRPVSVSGLMFDVTALRRAEDALREKEELHRLITESVSDMVALIDAEGRAVYQSASLAAFLGAGGNLRLGLDHVHPEDAEAAAAGWERALSGTPSVFGVRVWDEDRASWRWFEASATRVEHRAAPHVLVVGRDISERKQIEDQRRSHLRFLEAMNQVNRSLDVASDLGQMVGEALAAVAAVFTCDRVQLAAADPDAPTWTVAFAHARPEWPWPLGAAVPMAPALRETLRLASSRSGSLRLGPDGEGPVPAALRDASVRSLLGLVIRPALGPPQLLALHRCVEAQSWSEEDAQLLEHVGRRISDALSAALSHQASRESEAKLAAAQRMASLGHWEQDLRSHAITGSDETFRIFGIEPRSASPPVRTLLELVHPADQERVAQAARDTLAGVQRFDLEHRARRLDGSTLVVHTQGEVERDEAGQPVRLFGTVQDITRRRLVEDRLRASEARFRALVEHATDAFFLLNDEGQAVDLNAQACLSLGYPREELLGMHPSQWDAQLGPEDLIRIRDLVWANQRLVFDTLHRRKDGSVFPVEVHVQLLIEDGRRYSLALARDITERKRAERALVESHALLKAVVEGTSDAIFVKDLDGRYLMINSTGARNLGLSVGEVVGRRDRELFSPESISVITQVDHRIMASGAPELVRETHTVAGVTRTYSTIKAPYRDPEGKMMGVIGIARDVTELERMESQLRQSQKMEAIGRLAGGVAHDFNNLLTVIGGCSDLLLQDVPREDPRWELIEEIAQAACRASSLTRQLLTFSRKQILEPRPTDLSRLLTGLIKLVERLIGEDIEVRLELGSEDARAHVDPGHFEQAIVNLAVNARDAMPKGGCLTLEASTAWLVEGERGLAPDVAPGRYVRVSVSDTGHGIDEATISRIFEPFFTTKGAGQGTGLGLSMVYGFVKQSGGHVEVESQPGLGTTFHLYLPPPDADAVAPPAPRSELQPASSAIETVLLVEDEGSIRRLVRRSLESHGYRVLEARDGLEGLRLAQQHLGPIHLLLTDLVMPRMSGRELADELSATLPDLQILFMSGYSEDVVIRHGVAADRIRLLPKPFSPSELVQAVRAALSRASKPA